MYELRHHLLALLFRVDTAGMGFVQTPELVEVRTMRSEARLHMRVIIILLQLGRLQCYPAHLDTHPPQTALHAAYTLAGNWHVLHDTQCTALLPWSSTEDPPLLTPAA